MVALNKRASLHGSPPWSPSLQGSSAKLATKPATLPTTPAKPAKRATWSRAAPAKPATLPTPPPGLEQHTQKQQAPIRVRLSQVPGLLCTEAFVEAMLEQAGLEALVVGRPVVAPGGRRPGGLGEVTLGVADRDAARKVQRHFQGCSWLASSAGDATVQVDIFPAESPLESWTGAGGMEFVPGSGVAGKELVPGCKAFIRKPKALESWTNAGRKELSPGQYWLLAAAHLEQSHSGKHDPSAPMKVRISDDSFEACSTSTGCFSSGVSDADPQELASATFNWA